MKTNKYICYASLLLLLLLQACATKRQVTPATPAEKQQTTLRNIWQAQPDFSSAEVTKMRFSLRYADRQMAANGSLRFIKDSVLSLSLQPVMGIELFRVEITPSSLTVVDKMNRRYTQLSFAELETYMGFPLSFDDLQAVAMQRIFALGKTDEWISCNYTIDKTDNLYTLSFSDNTIRYTFLLDAVNYILSESKFAVEKMNASAEVRYLDEQLTDDVLFPQTIEVALFSTRRQATLTMTMLRRRFNAEVTIAPINLKNYAKVDLSVLLP